MSLHRMILPFVCIMLATGCKKELSSGIRTVITDPPVDDTTAFVLPQTITFDLAQPGAERDGMYGFLGSVTADAPADSLIEPLHPYLWRTGRQGNAFNIYSRLKALGVKRQILILSDFRNTPPTDAIFEKYGYGALADTLSRRAKELGYDFEWDLFNEPNDLLQENPGDFMNTYWIPAYRAIRKNLPEAPIHGPSVTMNNAKDPQADSALVYRFIDAAIASNTLPDYINWHFQIGYHIADWNNSYKNAILGYLESKGQAVRGVLVGETVRPGDERNTSPGVALGVFASVEVYHIPQIRASWTSQPVYGVETYSKPVLGGLLKNIDGTGRRGIWWTHAFYAGMKGRRIKCVNAPTGTDEVTGIVFRDDQEKKIKGMFAARDGLTPSQYEALKKGGYTINIANMNALKGLVTDGRVHVKLWRNMQTEDVVRGFGSDELPLILDKDMEIKKNRLIVPFVVTGRWNAILMEISAVKN